MKLDELYQIIINRQQNAPEGSYVASLFREGTDRIIQKVGEEAVEVVIAAKNDSKERTVSEIADLQFHLLVLMAESGITPDDVTAELDMRRTTD